MKILTFCGKSIICNGEVFTIPYSDCECEWYPITPEGQNCQVKLVGVQFRYIITQDIFECSNAYELGVCDEGFQDVQWFSTSSIIDGFEGLSAVPEDCLVALGCDSGSSTRACGEPIIKLPVFGLFALFASLVIIGLCYSLKRQERFK